MYKISPVAVETVINAKTKEWTPSSFDNFMRELNHITSTCQRARSMVLFRGHRKREWLLDSTFMRSLKATLFGLRADEKLSRRIVESIEFHLSALNLYLLKFGVLTQPSEELKSVAKQHEGVDPWFEWLRRIQQYPEEDGFFLKGTNFLDWTQSSDVALYFANSNRDGAGAIFICDATATGKTLQILPVGEILEKMHRVGNALGSLGAPLLFSPRKQLSYERAKNQQAVYFAQMDLRYDLEFIWRLREAELENETILVKLILPAGSEDELQNYLSKTGISRTFLFPDVMGGE